MFRLVATGSQRHPVRCGGHMLPPPPPCPPLFPPGLFRGHMSTVIKVFPCSAIQFGVVDACKKFLRKMKAPGQELSQLDCFLAGCVAGG